jgi:hypothetical protein
VSLGNRHWAEVELDEVVAVDLADDERELLRQGLVQWGGPTAPDDGLARVIGFENVATMLEEGRRIRDVLGTGNALTKRDWQRALVATEFVWASSFYGAAADWWEVTAWDDERTLRTLREVQSKLSGLRSPRRPRSGGT